MAESKSQKPSGEAIDILLKNKHLDAGIKTIARKVLDEVRINDEECLLLFEKADLSVLGVLANHIRNRRHGDNTYFNRNFHIEPTNVCLYSCSFCSYSRLIKKRSEGWEMDMEEIKSMVKSYDNQPVTEVHIVGGVMPQYDFDFYTNLFSWIKNYRPDLHIKALTPVEYHYMFKKAKISYEEGMKSMKEAGLQSMPGGGAEIFHPDIHSKIAGGKCTADQWLEIHEIWHNLGMRSNATMLYGHIEEYGHRVDHFSRLRALQDKTGGFQTFIPLKFRNKDNELSHLAEVSTIEDLKMYAVSRIYLDNFDHIKAYWPMIGRQTAQLSLAFGVDDIDGTIDDTTKIYSMAGAEEQSPSLTTEELVKLIRNVGRKPLERDTLYQVVKDYSDIIYDDEKMYRGYVSLPLVNK